MTVYELINFLTDAERVEIFSFEKGAAVYLGWSDEIPESIGNAEVTSIDSVFAGVDHLTINIECEYAE